MNDALLRANARLIVEQRQGRAAADARAARLVAVRRWQLRRERADRQVRLARLALR